jgi:ketopantoate reductase
MTKTSTPSVCIVGAGSMGVSTGYHLSLAGAAVTFLVRPHRQEQLSRPQVLYSYDDHSLKTFSGYELLTDPAELAGTSFDFLVITLDGAALRAEAGQRLVDEIGPPSGTPRRR